MTSPRRREIAAGVLYAITCVATVGALWIQLTSDQNVVDDAWGFAGMEGLLALAFGTVGFIVTRRTSNPAGWIFATMGIGASLQYLAEQYCTAALAPNSTLPGVEYVAWLAEWTQPAKN